MHRTSLTTKQIAEYCQVTQRTAVQWINDGKLKFFRTLGKHIRVDRQDFIEFLKENNIPVPEELTLSAKSKRMKKILIVDDDKGMVDSIRRLLKRENMYDLDVAYDGFEAGQKFITYKPDLVVLDVRMPRVDGYKLCLAIRNNPENKNVKILIISGTVDAKDKNTIVKFGADDYLPKPFDSKELKMKIADLLGVSKKAEDV